MASDFGISEGTPVQPVTLTALFAGIAAPTMALVIGRADRKLINLALCAPVMAPNNRGRLHIRSTLFTRRLFAALHIGEASTATDTAEGDRRYGAPHRVMMIATFTL